MRIKFIDIVLIFLKHWFLEVSPSVDGNKRFKAIVLFKKGKLHKFCIISYK